MKRVFADTAYFVALVRERDQLHRQATNLQKHLPGQLLTTEWILTEVANGLADSPTRKEFIDLLSRLRGQTDVEIVSASHEHFQQGCELYARRKDKDWSLTDCISFVIMREYGIDTALTSDEDFEQAGFKRLMDPGPQGVREPAAAAYSAHSSPTVSTMFDSVACV
jgi:predicted nucleic acid-binding protein